MGIKVGYARKSSDKQDLSTQINKLHDAGIPVELIYSDSMSGGTDAATRPGYRAMLDRLALGDVDELIVTEYSRVGRDTLDTLGELIALSKRGVKLTSLSANEKVLSSTPREIQPIVLSGISLGADLERKHNKERTAWVLQEIKSGRRKTKSGKPIGRPVITIDWIKIKETMVKHSISMNMASKLLGYKRSTFYNHKKAIRTGESHD